MADSLIIFKEGEKAKASEVNENFNYILQEMSTQIQNVRTYLEGEFKKISGNFVLPGTIIHIAYADITTTSGNVFIDVNGLKGPNKIGRDAFYLVLFSDGVLDTGKATPACRKYGICQGGSINAARTQGNPCEASAGWTDYACFGKILNANWQMEY